MKKRTTILTIATLALIMLGSSAFAQQPIKGTVTYHEDPTKPVPSVTVELWDEYGVVQTTTTNPNGKYIFTNVPYGAYTVKAFTTPIEPGGIDTDDADMIWDYLYNYLPLSPIELLAADVNRDTLVTIEDYYMLTNNWSNGFQPEWVFENVPVNHTGNKTNIPTMGGSSSGDVNGTFVPTGRNEEIAQVSYYAKNFSTNFTVEVFAKDLYSASAMGLVIDYPEGVNINNVTSQMGELSDLKVKNNRIVATWVNGNNEVSINANEPVLVISASANRSFNGSDIKFNVNNMSHFVSNGSAVKPEMSVPYLTVNGNDNLSYSYPNPSSESTVIYFSLPSATKANLSIYNLNGQLVKNIINEEMSAGQHSVTLSVTDLQEGVYFYNLTTSGNVNINQAKRLVVVH